MRQIMVDRVHPEDPKMTALPTEDALFAKIEAAIKYASELGENAYDLIDGRGLNVKRLAIRFELRALRAELATTRASLEESRANADQWMAQFGEAVARSHEALEAHAASFGALQGVSML